MDTETTPVASEHVGPVTETDMARLIAKLGDRGSDRHTPPNPTAHSVTRICETRPQCVRVAHYTDVAGLAAIYTWVQALQNSGHLQPGVEFTIEEDPGEPRGFRGMLYDPNADPAHRWTVLRRGHYLAYHGDKRLEVLDEHALHTRVRYTDPKPADSRPLGS